MKTPPSLVNTLHQKGFWTIHQFYNYLVDHHRVISVAYPTLNRYWKDGKLVGRKVGGQIRIPKEEVIRFLKDRGESLVGEEGVARPPQPHQADADQVEPDQIEPPEEVYEAPPPPILEDDPGPEPQIPLGDDEEEGFTIPIQS